jgi:hypothetical protein
MKIQRTVQVTAAEAGILESDIENFFIDKPVALNLGDIEILDSQVLQDHGGILDILAFQSELNTYFEIEIMRGRTDHWHISHVLDYWAKQQRAKKFSYHVAVLITESCRGRFKELLSTLPLFLPLIVMEMRVFKIKDSKDYYLRCEPIYYPDNVNLGVGDRLYVESSSGNILASKTSMLLIAHFLNDKNLISKTMRDISTFTGISLGAVNRVIVLLTERNFVEPKGNKPNIARRLINISGLEDHFTQIIRAFPDRKNYIKQNSSINVEQLLKKSS